MAQPATAAAVIAAVFASLLVAYIAYKIYARIHHRRMQRKQELPGIREPLSTYGNTLVSPGNSHAGTLYGTTEWPDGWKGSASRASLGTASHLNGYNADSRRPSIVGYLQSPQVVAADMSAPSSPLSPGVDADLPTPPGETYDHLRGVSSSSSTMALKRSYAASSRGSGAQSPIMSTRPRDSFLPHLPSNRESIHIVTPQPLGFGVGGMAQATDQRTLAFSKASGIGSTEDEFGSGLVWAPESGGSGGVNEFGAASTSRFGEEERMRYLAEGPNRTWSSASTRDGRGAELSLAASDVIMPGDSISRSRSPASKSRTPSPATKARATDREDAAAAGHPLVLSGMEPRLGPNAGPSFITQQSPLQMMSQGMDVGAPAPLPKERQPGSSSNRESRQHHRIVSDADTLATALSYGDNGGRGSPILSGGFAAGAPGTPHHHPLDLAESNSPGQSAHEGDGRSTPAGPSTGTGGSAARSNTSASDADGTTATNTPVVPHKDEAKRLSSQLGGRSFALGADGQLRMVAPKDLEDSKDVAKGGRASSWLPSIIMRGSA